MDNIVIDLKMQSLAEDSFGFCAGWCSEILWPYITDRQYFILQLSSYIDILSKLYFLSFLYSRYVFLFLSLITSANLHALITLFAKYFDHFCITKLQSLQFHDLCMCCHLKNCFEPFKRISSKMDCLTIFDFYEILYVKNNI